MEALKAEAAPVGTLPAIKALARFGPLAHDAIPRLRELEQGSNEVVSESAHQALGILNATW
jgi:hypothetical protein